MIRVYFATAMLFCSAAYAAAEHAPASPQQGPAVQTGMFPMQDGKSIYEGVCQGCHMPGGKGAAGAGAYPALAENPNLEASGYPVALIVNGQKAMPPFGRLFNDRQIAEVVNYIRTHFGNRYTDLLTAADVKKMR